MLRDLKSLGGNTVPVRSRSAAPSQYNPNLFPTGDGFGLFVFFDRYEKSHFLILPYQPKKGSLPVCGVVSSIFRKMVCRDWHE